MSRPMRVLDTATLVRMHTALKALLLTVTTNGRGLSHSVGICWNWQAKLDGPRCYRHDNDECYRTTEALAAKWPLTTRPGVRYCSPVPYSHAFGKWEGEQLTLRLSLMRYMLKRLRDIIRRGGSLSIVVHS